MLTRKRSANKYSWLQDYKVKIRMINRNILVEDTILEDITYGLAKPMEDKIYLARRLSGVNRKLTLLHELIHMFESHNVGIDEMSEAQVENISTNLLYFLQHNPSTLEYLRNK